MLNSQMTGKERILCAMKGDTPELDKDGIAPGDWFVVYGIRGAGINQLGAGRYLINVI